MAASIVARIISATEDKRLVLSNDQAGRIMDIGTDWLTIRIGFRFAFNPAGSTAAISGSPQHVIGLTSGTDAMYGDESCQHFLGVVSNASSLNYQAGSGNPYYLSSGAGWAARKRVGTTNTDVAMAKTYYQTGNVASIRNLVLVEIVKGSPDYTVSLYSANAATAAQADVSLATLQAALESATIGGISLSNYTSESEVIPVDEGADGPLNGVYFHWNRTTPTLEGSDVGYSRIA